MLRWQSLAQTRRGRDPDAGNTASPVEGDRDRAGEVHLPRLREEHASAGAVPCHREGMGGTQPPGHDHVREVRSASAPEPPGRALRSGRGADRVVDHGRRRGVGLRGARSSPPAAVFYYSRDRRGEHPQAHLAGYAGILQADAYDGYNKLYQAGRSPRPILEAACWEHAPRPFFAMADIEENARRKAVGKKEIALSPIAIEIVRRIDALFEIERSINGKGANERLAVRRDKSRPLVEELELYLRAQLDRLSRGHDLAKAINYILKRPSAFKLFLEDGRVCLSNNAAERGLRGVALGRRAWLFCGSDRGGQRAAMMYSLIVTAKMNDVDPQAGLADVLSRIASHPAHRLDELLPWNWESRSSLNAAQAA